MSDAFDERDLLAMRQCRLEERQEIDDPQHNVRGQLQRRHRDADVQYERMHDAPLQRFVALLDRRAERRVARYIERHQTPVRFDGVAKLFDIRWVT